MNSISAVTSDPSRLIVAAIESNLQTLQSSLSLNSSSSEENLKALDQVSDPRYELKETYDKMLKEDRQASIAETKGEYAAVNNLIIKYIGCITALVRQWRQTLKNKYSVDLLMFGIERIVNILFQDEYRQPDKRRITVELD